MIKKNKKTSFKTLGNCPFCENGKIEARHTILNGKKGVIFACSNAHWENVDDLFVLTKKSTCNFRIFSNCLLRYNKAVISEKEIKELLKNKEVKVKLYARTPFWEKQEDGKTKKRHKEYYKYIIPNKEFGIEVLWEE